MLTDAPYAQDADHGVARRAAEIHQASTVVVMHDHRPIEPDLPLMRAGGVTAKVYQLGVDVEISADIRSSAARREGWTRQTLAALEDVYAVVERHPDDLAIALSAGDVDRAKRQGRRAVLLGVEGAKLLEGELAVLRAFHRLGLRELQLRWAVPNAVVERDRLSEFGKRVVQECHRLGIIVDLTHIPEAAFFEAIALADKPPIVSHGTAGGDLNDARLEALARRGGVLGTHFYASYLGPKPTLDRVLDQVDLIVRKVGIDTVGLGVDLFPSDGAWKDFQNAQGTTDISWAIPDLSRMPDVTHALVARGYGEADIRKILGGNFLRVCRRVFEG